MLNSSAVPLQSGHATRRQQCIDTRRQQFSPVCHGAIPSAVRFYN